MGNTSKKVGAALMATMENAGLPSGRRTPIEIKKVRRYQKRRKSRRVEAVDQDFARWDAAAGHLGLTFSEFCRRAMNTAATAALKLAGVALVALYVIGCGAVAEPEPLACSGSTVQTPEGDRLLVSCNADVDPLPAPCVAVAISVYQCNILHASPDECAAFPGLCR